MRLRVYILSTVFTIFLLISGCSPTRHLGPNEKLLYKIELNGVEQANKTEITQLYQQEPNTKFLGTLPFLSIYYLGVKFYNPEKIRAKIEKAENKFDQKIEEAGNDSAKVVRLRERRENRLDNLQLRLEEGNFLMRRIGEPPAIYDTALTQQTLEQIEIYMNSNGFFRHSISHDTTARKKKVFLTINIEEDKPFLYTKRTYDVADTAVLNLIQNRHEARSLINVGEQYNETELTTERDRLEDLLKNNGYFQFRKQYITFEVDTSYADYTVRIRTVIDNPTDSTNHKVFYIRKVNFFTDAGVSRFGIKRDTILFNNVYYLSYNHQFKPKILDNKLEIFPGDKYSQFRTNATQRQLADLDVFRFNTVGYEIVKDSSANLLDATVNATPAKIIQETTVLGINLTEQLPGPFASLNLRLRNIFGGAEILDIGFRGGLEGQYSPATESAVYRQEYGTNVALSFPQIKFPFISREFLKDYSPRTRVMTGYTYINTPGYTRTNFDLSLDYIWQRGQRLQNVFSLFDVNLINTAELDPTFRDFLNRITSEGNPLINSFTSALVTSINHTVIYNTNNFTQTRDARFIRGYAELGGVTGLSEVIVEEANMKLATYKFLKLNADYRRYHKLNEKNYFVYRANIGYAQSLENNGVLPYEKYFFSGGGSSIRAWRPRKLGPGSYSPPFKISGGVPTNERDYRFEQPGEVLIETNFEYRFPMFQFINGALFVDAGNVWTLNDDPVREGSQFNINDFYKELAVATGIGFRFDFSFLILRIDVATKAYDPAEPEGERFVLKQFGLGNIFSDDQTAINLGIGYPF